MASFGITQASPVLRAVGQRMYYHRSYKQVGSVAGLLYHDVNEQTAYKEWLSLPGITRFNRRGFTERPQLETVTLGAIHRIHPEQWGKILEWPLDLERWQKYDVIKHWIQMMAIAQANSREAYAHELLNFGFTTARFRVSGNEALFATDHALARSTATYSNLINDDLGVTSLEEARLLFRRIPDDQGDIIDLGPPDRLWYPPALWPVVRTLLGSESRPGEISNNINTIRELGLKPTESVYLTDPLTAFLTAAKTHPAYKFTRLIDLPPSTYSYRLELNNVAGIAASHSEAVGSPEWRNAVAIRGIA